MYTSSIGPRSNMKKSTTLVMSGTSIYSLCLVPLNSAFTLWVKHRAQVIRLTRARWSLSPEVQMLRLPPRQRTRPENISGLSPLVRNGYPTLTDPTGRRCSGHLSLLSATISTVSSKDSGSVRIRPKHEVCAWFHLTAHRIDSGTGERHQGPVRLAGRGVYAIVNSRGKTPSRNETHLAYHLSHPPAAEGVQEELGIHTASSFVVQVKNPEVEPGSFGQRIGLPAWKRAKYPEGIMKYVYEKNTKGRSYSLRFAPCSCIELLDYAGAELLLIAARSGVEGVDQSLGEKRGEGKLVSRCTMILMKYRMQS